MFHSYHTSMTIHLLVRLRIHYVCLVYHVRTWQIHSICTYICTCSCLCVTLLGEVCTSRQAYVVQWFHWPYNVTRTAVTGVFGSISYISQTDQLLSMSSFIFQGLPTSSFIFLHLPGIFLPLPPSSSIFLHLPSSSNISHIFQGIPSWSFIFQASHNIFLHLPSIFQHLPTSSIFSQHVPTSSFICLLLTTSPNIFQHLSSFRDSPLISPDSSVSSISQVVHTQCDLMPSKTVYN